MNNFTKLPFSWICDNILFLHDYTIIQHLSDNEECLIKFWVIGCNQNLEGKFIIFSWFCQFHRHVSSTDDSSIVFCEYQATSENLPQLNGGKPAKTEAKKKKHFPLLGLIVSSLTKVISGHWCYIKQTYPDTFINITTLLIPEGAHLELIFSGSRISCWAATILLGTRKTLSLLLPDTTLAQQTPPWHSGRGGENCSY